MNDEQLCQINEEHFLIHFHIAENILKACEDSASLQKTDGQILYSALKQATEDYRGARAGLSFTTAEAHNERLRLAIKKAQPLLKGIISDGQSSELEKCRTHLLATRSLPDAPKTRRVSEGEVTWSQDSGRSQDYRVAEDNEDEVEIFIGDVTSAEFICDVQTQKLPVLWLKLELLSNMPPQPVPHLSISSEVHPFEVLIQGETPKEASPIYESLTPSKGLRIRTISRSSTDSQNIDLPDPSDPDIKCPNLNKRLEQMTAAPKRDIYECMDGTARQQPPSEGGTDVPVLPRRLPSRAVHFYGLHTSICQDENLSLDEMSPSPAQTSLEHQYINVAGSGEAGGSSLQSRSNFSTEMDSIGLPRWTQLDYRDGLN